MRRLLTVTAITAVLFASAGCAADRPASPTAPPGGTPTSVAPPGRSTGATPGGGSGASSGAAGGNAPEVCAAAQRAGETAVRTYV